MELYKSKKVTMQDILAVFNGISAFSSAMNKKIIRRIIIAIRKQLKTKGTLLERIPLLFSTHCPLRICWSIFQLTIWFSPEKAVFRVRMWFLTL